MTRTTHLSPLDDVALFGRKTTPLATLEDNALIQMTLAGDGESFSVLMDRHLNAVKRRISSMVRNATDADDLIQEVLLKVWRHLGSFRSEASFRTWMTRVAINKAFQALAACQLQRLFLVHPKPKRD